MSTLSIATIRRISTITRSLSIRSSSSTQSTQEISSTTLRNVIETDEELRQLSISSNSSSLPSEPSHTQNRDLRLNDIISRMESSATRTVRIRQRLAEDRQRLSTIGSIQTSLKSSRPSALAKNPPQITDLTLSTLIASTAHLGHHKSLTSPTNYPLIYGTRSDISIFDLRQTLVYLHRACNVIRETVENDGIVLFGKGIDGTQHVIKAASERLGKNGYALGHRPNDSNGVWVRGTLSNASEVLKFPRKHAKHLQLAKNGIEDQQNTRKQSKDNLESLKFQPSLIISFSPRESRVMLREAGLKQIPTIGIIDSDVDPRVVTYPIPANDDSIRLVELVAGVLARAGQEGLRRREQRLSRLMVTNTGKTLSSGVVP